MAGGKIYSSGSGGSNISVLIQSKKGPSSSESLDPLFMSVSSTSPFLGSRSMMSFEDVKGGNGSSRSFFRGYDQDDNIEEELEEYFQQPEKKRRLRVDQVQFLEKSFEVENKLEPERKIQLAKDLGLQPRQVAIWFQNRRARWKTKQLEKDYEALQTSYNTLKTDYDNLLKEKDKLKTQVNLLVEQLMEREKEKGNSELTNINSSFQQDLPEKPVAESINSEGEISKACKQEEISSAKSDIFDSDSPHYTDGVHFEPDQSDLSQDEDDNLSKTLFPAYICSKLDYSDPPTTSCNFGIPVEDQDHAFWSWSY
ncbi:homeobox-leucine zipper protein HAT5-like isoform X2 [Carica papaya]|uniref:homeobox-leucine zipper protein HAT5-like isoform X2 n=1 Tax=Carica papaya TaxID=3649 RepID=UPI000B8CE7D2|nr:homeobox-leucine zipper protein HAT5-like isoform X2 [Carica papaya]